MVSYSIPVTILSGFLGTGKTTFLNHILTENPKTRYAIIENEFGEQGIDNELIIRPEETIVELNNGCLCCTLHDNLYDILNELHDRRSEIDEIIIEATGVADPSGLAQPFISHPLIKKTFPLASIICLVDAELMFDHLAHTEEAINQISFSDILLINKTDTVDDEQVNRVRKKLQQLNPLAKIYQGSKKQFPTIDFQRSNDKLESLLTSSDTNHQQDNSSAFPVSKPHTHHHHHHTDDINSQTFIFEQPFDLKKLYQSLFVYLTFQSVGLFRIKGLLSIQNDQKQYVIQSVGKRLEIQEKRNWKPNEKRSSILVFIGKNLQRPGLENVLRRGFPNKSKQP